MKRSSEVFDFREWPESDARPAVGDFSRSYLKCKYEVDRGFETSRREPLAMFNRLWKRLLGNRGERVAARYLKQQGFRILHRNYTSRIGEIDLICLDGATIVFVEVKTRRSRQAGQPFEAVTAAKQKKLTAVALAYLKRYNMLERSARFDVVSIVWESDSGRPDVQHYRNAFPPAGHGQMFS